MKVKLIYKGRQWDDKNLWQVFIDGKQERVWKGVSGVSIGKVYEGERKGKHVVLKRRYPDCLGDAPVPQKTVEEWDAADTAEEGKAVAFRARRKMERPTELSKKIEELRPYIEKLSYSEKRAFFEYVLDKFTITTRPDVSKLQRSLRNVGRQLRYQVKKAAKEEG